MRGGLISSFCLFSSLRLSPSSVRSRCRFVTLVQAARSKIRNATGGCRALRHTGVEPHAIAHTALAVAVQKNLPEMRVKKKIHHH